MANAVTAAYARANLPELLREAARGKSTVVMRYRKPVAMIVPAPSGEDRRPKFGTGKGKVRLIDPHAFDPMTDEEVEAFVEGRS